MLEKKVERDAVRDVRQRVTQAIAGLPLKLGRGGAESAACRLRCTATPDSHPGQIILTPWLTMIRHIVLFTAKDKADIDRIVEGLSILAQIPHSLRLEVARNRKTDQIANDVDIIVYGEFDNAADLAAYKAHALYNESIERVRPLRDMRWAADYDVPPA